MAGKSSDIELIAGLKGGGSISGESGKRIQSQVNSIIQHIKTKPIDVELRLDPGSISKFKSDLDSLTKHAIQEASKIRTAYQNVIPPNPWNNGNGGGNGGGGSSNPYKEIIRYNNTLARTESLLKQVNAAREKWTAAGNDAKTKKEYDNLEKYKTRLETIVSGMKSGTMSLDDALMRLSKINAEFRGASRIISGNFMDFSIDDKIKKLAQAKKILQSMRDNLDKWNAASDGNSKSEYAGYQTVISNLVLAIDNFERGFITMDTFEQKLSNIKNISQDLFGRIVDADENHTVAKENQDYIKQLEKIKTLTDEYKKNLREWSAAKFGGSSAEYAGIEKLIADLEALKLKLIQSGTALDKFEEDVSEIEMSALKLGSAIKSGGKAHKTFGDKTFNMFAEMFDYIDAMDVVFEVFNQSKKMISNVTEIDTAMTELRKVTEETEASYSAFLDKASVRAREFGSTVSAVVSASADFARLGHDLDGASALADAALVYRNVGDGINDVETASSSIISTMQAFGVEAENAMSIVDKFNAVGNNFAISSSGIGDALLNSAASLAAGGNTLDESIALIAAANTTIQDPGRVGTALKTLTMYLKASKTEAEEAGISTEGMAESVSQLRNELMALTGGKVDIMSDAEAGSYKSTVEILRELSQVWDDLSDTSRTNITELIGGGVRNANIISALMNNFKIVEDAMATSAESSGSALAENEKYLDSIVGKTQQFKAAFETLSTEMFNSDTIKLFIDLGTGLVTGLTWVADHLGFVLAALTTGAVVGTISDIKDLIEGLDKNKGLGKLLQNLKEFKEGSGGSLSSGAKWGLAVAGIGLVVKAFQLAKQHHDNLIMSAQQTSKAYQDSTKSISEYSAETQNLISSINSGTLSSEELYEAKLRLLDIEGSLVSQFGAEAEGLNLVAASAEQAAESYRQLAAAQAEQTLIDLGSQGDEAVEQMSRSRSMLINTFQTAFMPDQLKTLLKEFDEVNENIQIVPQTNNPDMWDIYAIGPIKEANDAITEYHNSMLNWENYLNSDGMTLTDSFLDMNGNFANWSDVLNDARVNARQIIDDYANTAATVIDAKITRSKNYTQIQDEITDADSEYLSVLSEDYATTEERVEALKAYNQKYSSATFDLNVLKQGNGIVWSANDSADASVDNYLNGLVKTVNENADKLDFEIDLAESLNGDKASGQINELRESLKAFEDEKGKIDASDILSAGVEAASKDFNDLNDTQQAYADLKRVLDEYNYSVEDAIPIFKRYGLVAKSNAELLGDAQKSYTNAIAEQEAISTALSEQDKGRSVSVDTYENLIKISDEYANCLEYQNGVLQLNADAVRAVALERDNERLKTIEVNEALAQEEYTENAKKILELQKAIEDATGSETDELKAKKDSLEKLLEEQDSLEISISKYKLMAAAIREMNSARQAWINAQSAPRDDAAFTDAAAALNHINEVLNKSSSDIYGDIGTEAYKAALAFVIPESVTNDGIDSIKKYYNALKKIVQIKGGEIVDINTKKIWGGIKDLFEDDPERDGYKRVKDGVTFDDFKSRLAKMTGQFGEVTDEFAEAVIGALNVKGIEVNWGDIGADAEKTLTDLTNDAKEAQTAIADLTGYDIVLDTSDLESDTDKIERLNKNIEQAKDIQAKFDVDSSEAEYAAAIIDYCVAQKKYLEYETILSVDAGQLTGDIAKAVSLMNQFVNLKSKMDGGDVTQETADAMSNVVNEIAKLDKLTLEGFGIDPTSVDIESIDAALKELTAEDLTVKLGINEEAIKGYKAQNHDIKAFVIWENQDDLITNFKATNHVAYGTVYWENKYSPPDTSGGDDGENGADGTAHASGTARARGNWGTASGGRTLVGELGPELFVDVRSGRWQTVGEHGAEFVDLPRNAIVFNHLQTRHLLENGHIYGRGSAMAEGSALVKGAPYNALKKISNNKKASKIRDAQVSEAANYVFIESKDEYAALVTDAPEVGKEIVDVGHQAYTQMLDDLYDSYMDGSNTKEIRAQNQAKVESIWDEYTENLKDLGAPIGEIPSPNATGSNVAGSVSNDNPNTSGVGSGGSGKSNPSNGWNGDIQGSVMKDGIAGVDYFEYEDQFEDIYKGHKHLIEMEQEDVGVFLDWLESSYMNAYNQGILNLEDRYKYEEELREGRKEQFQDHLTDLEHEIERLGRTDGNELKIIDIYTGMIADLEKKISEAIEYGLDENSEYVQELTSQMYGYQDEIKDMQESALDDAKSALDELVDYRIDMLKKDIEDERDALDEKLSDLKDFYDKQKEMLQETYDKEKYLEEQSEKRKEKGDIQAEIDRLRQDDSAWAQKRILELQEELAEADKDLIDFEKDHALEEAQDALDKLYEKQEAGIQSQIEALEEKLNDPEALYNRALADIQSNTLALYDEMVAYNLKNGSGNAEDTAEMWEETLKALEKYSSTYGEPYKGVILVNPKSGYASGTFNASPGIHSVDELGPEYYFTSSDGTRYRVFSGGEKVLNAKATSFLYNFANSGGAVLSKIFEGMTKRVADLGATMSANKPVAITTGDVIIQGNADQSTVSELRRMKRDEMQWILKEFNKMNRRS